MYTYRITIFENMYIYVYVKDNNISCIIAEFWINTVIVNLIFSKLVHALYLAEKEMHFITPWGFSKTGNVHKMWHMINDYKAFHI